tara:strand:+ start:238 stop:606 length:369 start_codon:yes stop_codon:yes gene_type:complete
MAIKIVSLKSGEYVVTELQEAVDDKQRRQAFVFNNPHCVKIEPIEGSELEFDIEDPEARKSIKGQYKILLSRWNPLTPDTQIAVNPDWVISISEPMMSIVESYIKMTQPEETTLTETEVVDK